MANFTDIARYYGQALMGNKSTYEVVKPAEEVNSLLAGVEMGDFEPTESPYIDPVIEAKGKLTSQGLVVANFLVRAQKKGNDVIIPQGVTPIYRHFAAASVDKLPVKTTPLYFKTRKGQVHSTINPCELAYVGINSKGELDDSFLNLYFGTSPSGGPGRMSHVSVKLGVGSNNTRPYEHFMSDVNVKRVMYNEFFERDDYQLFECHVVGLATEVYFDVNRSNQDLKPNVETGEGFVEYYTVPAYCIGIRPFKSGLAGNRQDVQNFASRVFEQSSKWSAGLKENFDKAQSFLDSIGSNNAGEASNTSNAGSNSVPGLEEVENSLGNTPTLHGEPQTNPDTCQSLVEKVVSKKKYEVLKDLDEKEYTLFFLILAARNFDSKLWDQVKHVSGSGVTGKSKTLVAQAADDMKLSMKQDSSLIKSLGYDLKPINSVSDAEAYVHNNLPFVEDQQVPDDGNFDFDDFFEGNIEGEDPSAEEETGAEPEPLKPLQEVQRADNKVRKRLAKGANIVYPQVQKQIGVQGDEERAALFFYALYKSGLLSSVEEYTTELEKNLKQHVSKLLEVDVTGALDKIDSSSDESLHTSAEFADSADDLLDTPSSSEDQNKSVLDEFDDIL